LRRYITSIKPKLIPGYQPKPESFEPMSITGFGPDGRLWRRSAAEIAERKKQEAEFPSNRIANEEQSALDISFRMLRLYVPVLLEHELCYPPDDDAEIIDLIDALSFDDESRKRTLEEFSIWKRIAKQRQEDDAERAAGRQVPFRWPPVGPPSAE
jgi:hypothetical protein